VLRSSTGGTITSTLAAPMGARLNGGLDPHGSYSFYYSMGYRAGWTGVR
jgi:hypothetical protein